MSGNRFQGSRQVACVRGARAAAIALYFIGGACSAAAQPPSDLAFLQRPGAQTPLDAEFRDEADRTVRLADLVSARPVVLAPVYFECPMLCTEVLNGLVRGLRGVSLRPGVDFDVIALSFDPSESPSLAARKKLAYTTRFGDPKSAGWHFLTGEEPAIRSVTSAVGFQYRYEEDRGEYAHPAGVVVLAPGGRVSRYLFGVEYAPRDLQLALVEAGDGKIGSVVDELLLLCYAYDPATGRYGLLIRRVLRVSAAMTVVALGVLVYVVSRPARAPAKGRG